MPVYEYEICHALTGQTLARVSLHQTVEDRDRIQIVRRTVPRSVTLVNAAPPKLTQASEVLAGYRREEERLGSSREFRHGLGEFTPEQIKKAWSTPE